MHNESPVLVADEDTCGIELPVDLGTAVSEFLRAHQLPGPVIETADRRQIYIATAHSKARRAVGFLEQSGATIYRDGAQLPLRIPMHTWDEHEDMAIPPVVMIAAAVRAVTSGRGPGIARFREERFSIN